MKEWKKVKLGEILEEYCERNTNQKYAPVAVGKYGIRKREDIYSKKLSKDISKNKIIKKDTLTIGMGSNQIDIGILTEDETFCVSPAYTTYKIKNCNATFLKYYLELINPKISDLFMIVSARQGKSVDKEGLLKYKIRIPKIGEQDKISNILNNVEDIIKTLKMKKDKYFNQQMSIRETIFKTCKEYEELSDIVLDIKSGVSVNSENIECKENEVGVLKTSSVYGNKFNIHENKKVLEKEKVRVKCPVIKDTIIVSRMNTPNLVGACGYVEENYKNLFLPDRLWRVRINSKNNTYLYYQYLITKDTQKWLSNQATGTSNSMKNISKQKFLKLQVPIIKKEKQDIYAKILYKYDKIIKLISKEIEYYEQLKKAIMQKLFLKREYILK